MRRFRELVEYILADAQSQSDPLPHRAPEMKSLDQLQIHYHIGLSAQAKFLRVLELPGSSCGFEKFEILGLTWQGQEALDKSRDEADFRYVINMTY